MNLFYGNLQIYVIQEKNYNIIFKLIISNCMNDLIYSWIFEI